MRIRQRVPTRATNRPRRRRLGTVPVEVAAEVAVKVAACLAVCLTPIAAAACSSDTNSSDNASLDASSDLGDGTSADPADPVELVDLAAAFPGIEPGDLIAMRTASDGSIEWIERRTGRIRRLPPGEPGGPLGGFAPAADRAIDTMESIETDAGIETVAEIDVGTDGEQRGLLGHTEIAGVRYVAFTAPGTAPGTEPGTEPDAEPDANHLVVAALADGAVDRIVWDAGGTSGGAVGGHLEAIDGQLVLGIGQLTDWARDHGSGALLQLDPDGSAEQQPVVISDGYINPFAFTVADNELWVADNAVGDDTERIGRGDLDRDEHRPTGVAPRAPSALIALADGDLGVCGFLDAQIIRWSPEAGDRSGSGDVLGPCLTAATTLGDGTIATATDSAIVLLPPAASAR